VKVVTTVAGARAARSARPGDSWGFVPTMGYLHEGHLSLVRRASAENDRVAVSIFVNPAQFAPGEDLATYPRDLERDLQLLGREGVELVFAPAAEEIYGPGFQTTVSVSELTRVLEGEARPGHFQGVATVVAKLFNIIGPDRAYFGQKDAQQAAVIRRMAADLNFDLEVVVCPTVREPDGLAMSSRNVRLTPEQRAAAPVLFRALSAAAAVVAAGERDADALRRLMRSEVQAEPLARLGYASAADPLTLAELKEVDREVLLSLAVSFGQVRLIDNWLAQAAG
jgi:pantoate--beta-alanine ligase